jgi:hypothetical protein
VALTGEVLGMAGGGGGEGEIRRAVEERAFSLAPHLHEHT